MVLICLIFSVLSTIEQYASFANETLFWMVSRTCVMIFKMYKLYEEAISLHYLRCMQPLDLLSESAYNTGSCVELCLGCMSTASSSCRLFVRFAAGQR
jgi:hypothetical protein